MLRRAAAAIAGRGGGRPLALFIDDAHLLDDLSAVLVQQLAAAGAARVVVTVLAGERPPDAIRSLWNDGLTERIDLEPLADEAVAELLGLELAVCARLLERTEGNLALLNEIAFDAVSPRLLELVQARVADLPAPVRHGVEVLAVGGSISENLFTRVSPDVGLDAMAACASVRIERSPEGLVLHLTPPVVVEVACADGPPRSSCRRSRS